LIYHLSIRALETDRKLKKIKNHYIWLCFNNYRGTLIDTSVILTWRFFGVNLWHETSLCRQADQMHLKQECLVSAREI
jgi:hypothetical protein